MVDFRRTQVSVSFFVELLIVGGVAGVFVTWATDDRLYVVLAVPAAMLVLAALFYALTIEVAAGEVSFAFGPGLIAGRYRIADIASVEVVTNPWYYAFGVRGIPGGWLFNASGFQAVELTFRGGRKIRLGTDRPEELKAAIEQAA